MVLGEQQEALPRLGQTSPGSGRAHDRGQESQELIANRLRVQSKLRSTSILKIDGSLSHTVIVHGKNAAIDAIDFLFPCLARLQVAAS